MIKGNFIYKKTTYKYRFCIHLCSFMEFGDYYDVVVKYKPKGKLLNHSIYMISFPDGYNNCYDYYGELYENGILNSVIEEAIIKDLKDKERVKLFK